MIDDTFLATSLASVLLTSVSSNFLKACLELDKRDSSHSCLPMLPQGFFLCFNKKSLPKGSWIFEKKRKNCMRN